MYYTHTNTNKVSYTHTQTHLNKIEIKVRKANSLFKDITVPVDDNGLSLFIFLCTLDVFKRAVKQGIRACVCVCACVFIYGNTSGQ